MNQSMRRAARLGAAVAVSIAIAMLASACGKSNSPSQYSSASPANAKGKESPAAPPVEGLKLSADEMKAAGVRVETLAPQVVADTLTVTATIRPDQDRIARIAPRVEGRIVAVPVKLGDSVKAGQVLVLLDSVAIGEAQSTLMQAASSQRLAAANLKRAQQLSAEEIIAGKELMRAKSEAEQANTQVRAAQDRLRLLGAPSSTGSGHAASTFSLSAPFAGAVIEKNAILGELGRPDQPLFTIADLSTVWIQANLNERDLPRARVGAAATVTVSAYPNERFEGRLTYIASGFDKQTRTVPARIEVDNRDGRLKPEMFATAAIEVGDAKRELLTLPNEAIVLVQGQATVFIEKNGGFTPRAIDPGDKLSERTVIRSGVMAGENVVVAGAYALKARLLKSQIGGEH